MSSPFASYQEFSDANGPIYTFANNPTMIGFLLFLCLAITLYFLYASYTMKQESESGNSVTALGLLILAGAASLFGLVTASPKQPQVSDRPHHQRHTTAKSLQPLALLGMVGIGRSTLQRKRQSRRRKPRS